MKLTKKIIVALLMMTVVPMCAMENKKSNVISDEDLLAKKKAFALELKSCKKLECEWLVYPKGSNIKTNLKALNEELGLSGIHKVIYFGDTFLVPAGMDERFIHPTLVPKRIPYFEGEMVQ